MAQKKKYKFEEGIEVLDGIIDMMESGELELEDAVKEYSKAMEIIAECHKTLEEVEGKIKKIVVDKDGIKFEDFE